MYDVFFLSYDEPNANENWSRVKRLAPLAKRIHGVQGILAAHKEAARLSKTDAFFVVDGDAWILPGWDFADEEFDDFHPYDGKNPSDCVIVWKSLNPYNGLTYGYGGIKLMSKSAVLNAKDNVDVATSVSKCFIAMDSVVCETKFATSPWNAWRGAFRECAKLSSATISDMSKDQQQWLETWTTVATGTYANYILAGAKAGKEFGKTNVSNREVINLINDFEWLKELFNETVQ